jgi:large subunit ribosomal protein L21
METIAVVKYNGKQYLAKKGDHLVVDRISAKKIGDKIQIKDVLLASSGKTTKVGTPVVKGAVVEAKVLSHPRGSKGVAFRYRAKKRERTKRGFRADLTELEVTNVKA